jgi:hypothetical protein
MGGPRVPDDRRPLLLRAALSFLRLPPTEPELQLLHRWLDTWTGVGLITVGVERQGLRLSLSHIADGGWRAMFMGDNARLAPRGFGVTPTPWQAVQQAAWGGAGRVTLAPRGTAVITETFATLEVASWPTRRS